MIDELKFKMKLRHCVGIADGRLKESLPGHVRAPAVFKCHRVSAIGNGEDEFAYLATVQISGHVFKGFLYDHGVDGKIGNAVPCVSELQLGNNCSGKNRECSSAIGLPNNTAYPASATSTFLNRYHFNSNSFHNSAPDYAHNIYIITKKFFFK